MQRKSLSVFVIVLVLLTAGTAISANARGYRGGGGWHRGGVRVFAPIPRIIPVPAPYYGRGYRNNYCPPAPRYNNYYNNGYGYNSCPPPRYNNYNGYYNNGYAYNNCPPRGRYYNNGYNGGYRGGGYNSCGPRRGGRW